MLSGGSSQSHMQRSQPKLGKTQCFNLKSQVVNGWLVAAANKLTTAVISSFIVGIEWLWCGLVRMISWHILWLAVMTDVESLQLRTLLSYRPHPNFQADTASKGTGIIISYKNKFGHKLFWSHKSPSIIGLFDVERSLLVSRKWQLFLEFHD